MRALACAVALAAALQQLPGARGAGCTDTLSCSLNGDCVAGACVCDAQWTGARCEKLNFRDPLSLEGSGYKVPGNASWGGNTVLVDGVYHMFVAHMVNGCGLDDYGSNSAIARVTSNHVDGPFTFQEIVVPAYAHNPTVRRVPGGKGYLLYYIGGHVTTPKDCTAVNGTARAGIEVAPAHGGVAATRLPRFAADGATIESDITVAFAPSVLGPWTAKPVRFDAASANASTYLQGGFTNPSPHLAPDGSVTLGLQAGAIGKHYEMIGVARAPSWDGVYTLVTGEPVIPLTPLVCIAGMGEDPFLWEDARGWHMLIHGMCPTGFINAIHAFSNDDCRTWHTGHAAPYSYTVPTTEGSHFFWRVERPQLAFERYDDATGRAVAPQALYLGVCDKLNCLGTPSAKNHLNWRTWTIARGLQQA